MNINLIYVLWHEMTNVPSNFLKSVCAKNFLCAKTLLKGKFMCTPKISCVRSSHGLCVRAWLRGNIGDDLIESQCYITLSWSINRRTQICRPTVLLNRNWNAELKKYPPNRQAARQSKCLKNHVQLIPYSTSTFSPLVQHAFAQILLVDLL